MRLYAFEQSAHLYAEDWGSLGGGGGGERILGKIALKAQVPEVSSVTARLSFRVQRVGGFRTPARTLLLISHSVAQDAPRDRGKKHGASFSPVRVESPDLQVGLDSQSAVSLVLRA